MNTILHTTTRNSTIEYDPTVPCVIGTITEFLLSEEYRTHMNKGLEWLIEKKQIHGEIGWLANTKSLPSLHEDDLTWVMTDWASRTAQAGICYIACVLPDDEIVRISNDYFDEKFKVDGLILRNFMDLESARQWLSSALKKA